MPGSQRRNPVSKACVSFQTPLPSFSISYQNIYILPSVVVNGSFDVVNSPAHAFHYIKIGLSLHSLENILFIQYNKGDKVRLGMQV